MFDKSTSFIFPYPCYTADKTLYNYKEIEMATMPTLEAVSRYELERGKPMPSMNHGVVQARLIVALDSYDEYTPVSELTLDLSPAATPDVCIYPKLTLDWQNDQIRATEMPLTTIEIQSPTQSTQELVTKIQRLLTAGVQSAWLVEPTLKLIAVYLPDEEPQLFTKGELYDPATEIRVRLDQIFR